MTVHARPLLLLMGPSLLVIVLEDRVLGAGFAEVAGASGISYIPSQTTLFGDGLAFVDLDDDGDADLVLLGRADGLVGIYENDGAGHFANRSLTSGIALLTAASGVAAADYDDDGDLDLAITRQAAPNALLRNDGGFTFTDVAAAAGVDDDGLGGGPTWGDFDGDGRCDLFVPNRHPNYTGLVPNRLYWNVGDGTFTEVAAAHGVDILEYGSFQGTFIDYDLDGDHDLYVIANRGFCDRPENARSRLFRNDGGRLGDVTELAGVDACGVDAMSIATGDFDGNGWIDFYVTNVPNEYGNALLMNQGDGTFLRDEVAAGVQSFLTGWGSEFFDFDHDGRLDLYVCDIGANRLYTHAGSWPCVNVAVANGVATSAFSYAVASADIDGDGDLDLAVGSRNIPVQLFANDAAAGAWVRFDVVGEGGRRHALGATVRVRTGGTWQVRQVVAGNNYKTQNELIQHVGLGGATVLDEIEVRWLGGATRTFTNVAAERTWRIVPPDRVGDLDEDGAVGVADLVALILEWGACGLDQCPADLDLDGTIGVSDLVALILNWSS